MDGPTVEPCDRCGETRHLHAQMSIKKPGDEVPEKELRCYLCRCYWPPVQILERKNGGEWAWRPVRSGGAA